MVVHSPDLPILEEDLEIAKILGVNCVEVLPRWSCLPNPGEIRHKIEDQSFKIWSTHGPWGGRSVKAPRIDLASLDADERRASVDDTIRALDWTAQLGASLMVVHPGGLSHSDDLLMRTEMLTETLGQLADEASARNLKIGVENMPKGVNPGSFMADLANILRTIGHPNLGLVLDTGHARISHDLVAETLTAKEFLLSTHVHDNNGRSDSHHPPGEGVIDWQSWSETLDVIHYRGPVMLECVKMLRERRRYPAELVRFLQTL